MRVFQAAAAAHRRTGAPILTHCDKGTAGIDQVRRLADGGVDLGHVALSHVDKVVDRGYHRELAATGVALEYDGSFRWGDAPNGTLALLEWMVEDDLLDRVVLGMDAARQGYYAVYGGRPGLTWLLDGFTSADGGARSRGRRPASPVRRQPRTDLRVRFHGSRDHPMTDALRTSVVGSHARPSWFVVGDRRRRTR